MTLKSIGSYLYDITGFYFTQSDVKFFCDVNGFKPSDVAFLEFNPKDCRFCFTFKKYCSIKCLYYAKSYLLAMIKCKW